LTLKLVDIGITQVFLFDYQRLNDDHASHLEKQVRI